MRTLPQLIRKWVMLVVVGTMILVPLTPVTQAQVVPQPAFNPPNQTSTKKNEEILRKWREQDQQQCEIEAKDSQNQTLGQAVAGITVKPLKKAINDKIGANVLPIALHNTVVGNAAGSASVAIQNNLQQEIKVGFSQRWGEEFPRVLAKNMEAGNRLGYTADYLRENRGQFRQLIEDSVRETWPQVMNRDFIGNSVANSWRRGFESSLKDNFKLEFGRTAKPTIEQHYRLQIEGMFKEIPGMVEEQVNILRSTIEGTRAGTMSIINNLKGCALDPICWGTRVAVAAITEDPGQLFPEIDQLTQLIEHAIQQIDGIKDFLIWLGSLDKEKIEKMVQDLVDGLTLQLEESITDPKNINRLTDAVLRAIEDPVNQSFDEAIDKISDSIFEPTEALIDSIDTLDEVALNPILDAIDQQLNIAVATLTGPLSATIDTIGDTIATTIDNTLGSTFYSLADGFTGTANEAGNFVANAITNAGNGIWGAVYPFPPPNLEVVPDDFQGTLAPNQMLQSDFDLAQANGIRLTEDQNTIPGQGAMSYEAYQAAFPEGAPLEGTLDGVSTDVAQATEESAEQVAEQAVNNQAGGNVLTSNIAQGLKGGFINIVAGGVGSIVRGIPFVGPIAAPIVEKYLLKAMGAAGIAPVAGGLPVMDAGAIWTQKGILTVSQSTAETSGEILNTDKQIKDLNEKLTILQIQSCTNLKVLRRIQLLNEEKAFIWDDDARKAQAAAINDYIEGLRKSFRAGVPLSPGITGVPILPETEGENSQSVVPDPNQFVNQRAEEAGLVLLEDVKSLAKDNPGQYPVIDQVVANIENEEGKTLADELRSPYTPEQIENFRTKGSLDGEGAYDWDASLKFMISPALNPLLASNKINQQLISARSQAAAAAEADLDRGDGFVGIYDCPDTERVYYAEGDSTTWYCRNYVTKTPPGLVRDLNVAGLTSAQRQLESGQNVEFLKDQLKYTQNQASNYRRYLEYGSGSSAAPAPSIFDRPDPCPGPGPCVNSGWKKAEGSTNLPPRSNFQPPQTNTNVKSTVNLGDLLDQRENNLNTNGNNSNDGGALTAFLIGSVPSLATILDLGGSNTSGISWGSTNAESCQARNDWLSDEEIIATRNSEIPLSGSGEIKHPLKLNLRLDYVNFDNSSYELNSQKSLPSNLLAERWEYEPTNEVVGTDSTYRLTFFGVGGGTVITAGGPGSNPNRSKARVVELFREVIEARKNEPSQTGYALSRYNYTYGTTENNAYFAVTPRLTYQLRCAGNNNTETLREVTLTR